MTGMLLIFYSATIIICTHPGKNVMKTCTPLYAIVVDFTMVKKFPDLVEITDQDTEYQNVSWLASMDGMYTCQSV